VETIELADFRELDQLFRKILYVSIIDTLAKTALRKCSDLTVKCGILSIAGEIPYHDARN
jgi:hypothetical protein